MPAEQEMGVGWCRAISPSLMAIYRVDQKNIIWTAKVYCQMCKCGEALSTHAQTSVM